LHGPVGSVPSHAVTHPYLGPHGTNPTWTETAGTRYLRYSALTGDVWTLSVAVYHNAGRRRRNDALLGTGHIDVSAFLGSTCPPETFVVMLRSPSGKSDRGIVVVTVEGLLGLFRLAGDALPQAETVPVSPDVTPAAPESSESAHTTADSVATTLEPEDEEFVIPANSLYRGEEYRCQLIVTLVEVKHLVHTSSYLQQAPYGILTLYGHGAQAVSFGQTESVKRGGDNPRWTQGNTIELLYAAKRSQPLKLQCEIWNTRTFVGDQILGKGRVDVSGLIGRNRTNVFLEVELRAPDKVSVAGIACVCVHNHVLQVGDGPREAKHKYSLVDLIGTPEPHVTDADRKVGKPCDVVMHGDLRHRATPTLCLGPWLSYKHSVIVVAAGGGHSMCITQGRDLLSRRLWAWYVPRPVVSVCVCFCWGFIVLGFL
jgi:C2 domain